MGSEVIGLTYIVDVEGVVLRVRNGGFDIGHVDVVWSRHKSFLTNLTDQHVGGLRFLAGISFLPAWDKTRQQWFVELAP